MNDQNNIRGYLAYNLPGNGQPFSTLAGAYHEARWCTDRDLRTGQKLTGSNMHHDRWSGALVYMALLDQIGGVLNRVGQTPSTYATNSFLKALDLFRSNNEAENKALYALRCSFAHDFGLVNENNRDPLLQHHFTVFGGTAEPLVTLPSVRWGGGITSRNDNNVTRINLELLGDAVEDIYSNLVQLNNQSNLSIALPGGSTELNAKYFQIAWFRSVP